MVSVHPIMTDMSLPIKESGPYCLNKSRTSPKLAEAEMLLRIVRGINSDGKEVNLSKGLSPLSIISKAPEALMIPTATIRPIKVGIIVKIVFTLPLAPSMNTSKILIFLRSP